MWERLIITQCFLTLSAKNLILAGVKSVTLHDEGSVELWDMSSNFVFTEKDLGKNRALASVQKLQELNNAVTVLTLTAKLTKEQLSDFQVILQYTFFSFVLLTLFIVDSWHIKPPLFLPLSLLLLVSHCFLCTFYNPRTVPLCHNIEACKR